MPTVADLAAVAGDNQSDTAAATLPVPLVARVTDEHGNPISGQQVTWSVIAGGGSVAPATATTDSAGKASTVWTLGSAAGGDTVRASAGGFSVTFSATAVAGAPDSLLNISGDAQSAAVGATLPDSLVVRLIDQHGNPIVGQQVTWSVITGGGSVEPTTDTTDLAGMAHAAWTLGMAAGADTVRASAGGLSVTFSATATIPPSGLTYSVNPAIYTVGVAVIQNTPTSSGGAVTSYSVSPLLPAGLSLNATTGAISGTPSSATAMAVYTVTATNSGGSTNALVTITVLAPYTIQPPDTYWSYWYSFKTTWATDWPAPHFQLSTSLTGSMSLTFTVSGQMDVDPYPHADDSVTYHDIVNASGVRLPGSDPSNPVGTTLMVKGCLPDGTLCATHPVGAVLIGNPDLGWIPLYAPTADNGLGSSSPPTALSTTLTLNELFGQTLPSGTLLFLVYHDVDDSNTGSFAVSITSAE